MATGSRRKPKVPQTVLERASQVAQAPARRAPPAAPAPRGKPAPREKVISALKRLKSHPMD